LGCLPGCLSLARTNVDSGGSQWIQPCLSRCLVWRTSLALCGMSRDSPGTGPVGSALAAGGGCKGSS
jgi:hypothetical protein